MTKRELQAVLRNGNLIVSQSTDSFDVYDIMQAVADATGCTTDEVYESVRVLVYSSFGVVTTEELAELTKKEARRQARNESSRKCRAKKAD